MAEKDAKSTDQKLLTQLKQIADIIQNAGLKQHHAQVGQMRLPYFRADNFHAIVLENKDAIMKKLPDNKRIESLETTADSITLGQLFIENGLVVPLTRHPQAIHEANKKWPKNLIPTRDQNMKDKGFYHLVLERSQGQLGMMLTVVILIIFAIMLFPIWPMNVKIIIWYISFYLLVALFGIAILRLILYVILFTFGCDFWLFPNFFIDSNNPLDSFIPLLSFEKREDDARMMLMRLLTAVMTGYLVYKLGSEPENLGDISDFTTSNLDDLFNWGNDRLILGKRALDSNDGRPRKKTAQELFMEAIIDEEEEEKKENEEPEQNEDEEHETELKEEDLQVEFDPRDSL